MSTLRDFIRHHYRHFNAAALFDAANAYEKHVDGGGVMFMTLAGATSTAELGVSLAEMIRQEKVHAICCTGANLEEDIFNLVAHEHYAQMPQFRQLNSDAEEQSGAQHRKLETIALDPEAEAIRRIEDVVLGYWREADKNNARYFPHEILYRILLDGKLEPHYEIDTKDSWLLAAAQRGLPIIVPGWEDSTLGNLYASHCIAGRISNVHTVRGGIEYMMTLADWYKETCRARSIGFFQVGGGIAGDFPFCVVANLEQDLGLDNIPPWGYYCQISDAKTSPAMHGGGALNKNNAWDQLSADTPKFIIESDATIVAPLIFGCVLDE